MCICIIGYLVACSEMLFSVYVLGGCYIWITLLVQNGVQTKQCGQRWNKQTPSVHYQTVKTESPPNSWPFHVGVYTAAFGPFPFCGGTLIESNWVLTAAHCIAMALECKYAPKGQLFSYHDITGHNMAVVVGGHKYRPLERPAYNVKVKRIILHPSFHFTVAKPGFDIALLQLNRDVKRSRWTEYACLPKLGLSLSTGQFCNFAGWGFIPNPPNPPTPRLSETLMEARVPIASNAECYTSPVFSDPMESFCTNNSYGASCDCDSGAGLHCLSQDGSKWFVYGVLSSGPEHCLKGYDIFAFTATKLNWIQEVIGSNP